MENECGKGASGWRAAFIYYDWVLFVDLAVRLASTALEKASESHKGGKYIHIYNEYPCTLAVPVWTVYTYISIYIYIHTWLWPLYTHPPTYYIYIYIPYLAAASLNVSFRLKRNRHHTTNSHTTTTRQRFQSYVYVTNHYKQFREWGKYNIPDKWHTYGGILLRRRSSRCCRTDREGLRKKNERNKRRVETGEKGKADRWKEKREEKRTLCFED